MSWIEQTEMVLSGLSYPYDVRRYESDDERLPDTFVVYTLIDDVGKSWTDNKETAHIPRIQISLYFRSKPVEKTVPDEIEAAFIAAGFMRSGGGTLPYSNDTGHYGRYFDFKLYERR